MAARSPIGGRVAILLTRTERCAPSDAQRSAAALRSSSSWLIPTTRRIVLYVIGLIPERDLNAEAILLCVAAATLITVNTVATGSRRGAICSKRRVGCLRQHGLWKSTYGASTAKTLGIAAVNSPSVDNWMLSKAVLSGLSGDGGSSGGEATASQPILSPRSSRRAFLRSE